MYFAVSYSSSFHSPGFLLPLRVRKVRVTVEEGNERPLGKEVAYLLICVTESAAATAVAAMKPLKGNKGNSGLVGHDGWLLQPALHQQYSTK